MFTIQNQSETRTVKACTHNLADYPGGVTIAVEDLIDGSILREGTAVGLDSAGKAHVIKTAAVYEAAGNDATVYKVKKGSQFKVGDILALGAGKTGKTITAINNSDAAFDAITVDATLGTAVSAGDVFVQVASAASSSKLKYTPVALLGDSFNVKANTNLWSPAVTIGQFKTSCIPPLAGDIKSALKTIVFI